MNGKKALMIGLLALGLAAARATAEDLWLHVKVHDAKEGSHVNINLPLSVVEKSAAFIPTDARHSGRIRFDDTDMSVAELREVWRELRKHPNANFITVDEPDGKVRVSLRGNYLVVLAQDHKGKEGRGEDVEMKIPASVVEAMLSADGDELDVAAAIRALAREGEGELVTVTGDNETVRIWVDATAESR